MWTRSPGQNSFGCNDWFALLWCFLFVIISEVHKLWMFFRQRFPNAHIRENTGLIKNKEAMIKNSQPVFLKIKQDNFQRQKDAGTTFLKHCFTMVSLESAAVLSFTTWSWLVTLYWGALGILQSVIMSCGRFFDTLCGLFFDPTKI